MATKRRKLRWILIIAGLAVLTPVLIVLSTPDALMRFTLEKAIAKSTGCPTRLEAAEVHLFRKTLALRGLDLDNPPGFPPGPMLRLKELRVAWESLHGAETHLRNVEIELARMTVVQDEQGVSNVEALNAATGGGTPAAAERRPDPAGEAADALIAELDPRPLPAPERGGKGEPAPPVKGKNPAGVEAKKEKEKDKPIRIDRFRFRLDEIMVNTGLEPQPQLIKVMLDRTWTNVTDMAKLEDDIQQEMLIRAGLGALGLDPSVVEGMTVPSSDSPRTDLDQMSRDLERSVEDALK